MSPGPEYRLVDYYRGTFRDPRTRLVYQHRRTRRIVEVTVDDHDLWPDTGHFDQTSTTTLEDLMSRYNGPKEKTLTEKTDDKPDHIPTANKPAPFRFDRPRERGGAGFDRGRLPASADDATTPKEDSRGH